MSDVNGVPQYFLIDPKLPKAYIKTFKKGLKMQVTGEDFGFQFDVQDYENAHLFQYSWDYFPIIITIEGTGKQDEYQNQITYGMFHTNQTSHVLEF